MKSLLDMSRKIIIKFGRYLSEKVGRSEVYLSLSRDCISVREIVDHLIKMIPQLRDESLIVIREGKVIPLSALICEDCVLEVVQSLVGG